MSGSSPSFLDQFPDPVAPAPSAAPPAAAGSPNFLDQFPNPVAQSSAAGAFVRGAAQGAAPALGGLAAAGAGAEAGGAAGAGIGAEIGGALGVAGGPLAELTVPAGAATGAGIGGAVGAFAGGLAGFFGGSAATQSAQNYALKQMPDNWQDALGASDRQQRVDQEQHPIASFLGGLAPYAVTMSPGALTMKAAGLPADATAFQRIMANPLTSRLFGGAAMGGMQIGQEKIEGQPVNWTQAAIATGFGMVFNKPNAFGESISNAGTNAARELFGTGTPMTVQPPTLAESADAKVMGPGINEAVFQGQQQQDPAAEQAAQIAASTERSLTGEQPAGPDLNAVARQMHPELFAQYDDLQQQQASLSQWINEAKNPPDDQLQAAQENLAYAKGQFEDATSGMFGPNRNANVPRLRAMLSDAQAQYDEIAARKAAWESGDAQDTLEIAQARQHLQALDFQVRDMLPDIQAAHRRAADAIAGETVPPVEPEPEEAAPQMQPVAAPASGDEIQNIASPSQPTPAAPPVAKPIADQRAAIASDVERQLIAAGRPPTEAEAGGQLIAARMVARAGWFKGALGTPEELYRRDGATYRGENGQQVKVGPTPKPIADKTPAEVWNDYDTQKRGIVSEQGFANPGDVVEAPGGGDMLAVNQAAGDTQVLVDKPDETGESQAYIHNAVEGTVDPIGPVDFKRVAQAMREEPEQEPEPLPPEPDQADAEALRRSSAPEPAPEAVAERDIATTPAVVVPKPEPVTEAKDAYADKWFGTREKAEAFIEKKRIGETHEVIQTVAGSRGNRFEILPIGEVDKMNEASRLAGEKYAAARAAGEEPPVIDRKGREWRVIGKNDRGQEITEDERGVRSIVSDGMRNIEPVTINPRGGISVNRGIHPEYEVAPETPATDNIVENPAETANNPAQAEATNPEQEPIDGVQQQSGEAVRPGTSTIPDGSQPAIPSEPKPIRRPAESSPFSGGAGSGDARDNDDAGKPKQNRAEPPLSTEIGSVTKPPAIGTGVGAERPDTPAATGVSNARRLIEERSRSNYRITDADQIGQGTPKQKIKANIEAIRIVKMLEDEARNATPEEKAVLVKYTGWGAFAQDMFAAYKDTYKEERQAFRSLVTDEEYEAARASTLNAHYTSPDVVKGMWDALVHFGYDGGLAIEPSAGSGNFIGMTPDSVAPRTAWTGVELDPLTGKIAKALYGGAEINIQGYETLKRPSNYYDVAISNVPFGSYNLKEKPFGSHAIHDFFFVKSLDKVRPGGVVAFVTSRFTMDKLDPAVRRLLSKSADLVGAIRLPGGDKGAFAGNAGTAVTTDIMFLRKRIPGEQPFPGADWLNTKEIQTPEGPATINEYFADHPDMMLGEMRLTRGMYRDNEPTLVGSAEGLHEKILEAARKMPDGAFTQRAAPPPPTLHSNDITSDVKDGAFFVQDGKVYKRISGQGVEQSLSAVDQDRVSRLSKIRDIVNELLTTQLATGEGAKEKSEVLRENLRNAYNGFVKKHGPINKEVRTVTSRLNKQGEPIVSVRYPNMAEFKSDPDAFKVYAIERYDAESDTAEPATIQTKDVISAPTKREINGPADALAAVLDEKGRVDLQTMGDMIGAKTEDEVIARMGDMIYQNPDGREWEPSDKYLSGDVVQKLEEARAIAASEPAYLRNVAALEKVQPTPLEPHDITAQFGAPWVPQDVYEDFLEEIGAGMPVVRRVPVTAEWKVDARGWTRDATAKYGTDRTSVKDIVDAAMNNRQVTVYDAHADGTRSVNQKATEEARIKVDALKEAFSGDQDAGIDSWVWKDPDRAEKLAAIYNRTFNNVVARKFDGSHQTFPGMSADLKLRPHQADAVWRSVQNGNTLYGHVVGAGKTFTMIASGMEQRRLGLINKPMYVVPNHMLEQFSREFLQAYPDAKILVAQKDEMTRDLRKAFIGKVAANDWDGVVITHDAFGRINTALEFRKQYIRDQMDELERVRVAEAQENGDKAPTVKALEKIKKNLQSRLDELLNETRKDEGTSFEESGVDFLYVDEAHKFKNLSFLTRLQRVKGLSQGNSQRAEDLFLKMRYLEQKRQGRSAVFATGTPVSNTMAEIWTMMRYLELDKLKERGLDNFDAWASTFGKVVNNMELSADGRTFKEVSSFSRFVNVPELISLYSEIADTRTADMLNLPRPEVKTRSGAPGIEITQAEPSPEEEEYINSLVALAESIKGSRPEKGKPNMLSVVTSGRKVATDGRLVDPEKFSFNPNGKIGKAVENISRIYKEGKEPGLAQMVFLDMGVPTPATRAKKAPTIDEDGNVDPNQTETPRINLYDDLKQRLVAEGIPGKEIAFIHDAGDDEKKAKLFAKVRSGEVRVIVGSSEKMGVGTNVQQRLIAMHHLDAPWKPADVEQRDGRIVRQGNMNPTVQIYRYVTKRSFDAFMWQKLDTKSKFISQVLSGAKGSRHAEDIDNPLPEAAEMKAAASGDPRIMEHAELSRQVRALAGQKRAFDTTVSRATWELKTSKARVADLEASLSSARSDAARVTDISGDKFSAKLGSQTYDSRKDAGTAIVSKINAMPVRDFYRSQDLKIGEMSGFDMHLEVDAKWNGGETYLYAQPSLVGDAKYSAPNGYVLNEQTDPVGLMRKFEGLLNQISAQPGRIELGAAGERKNIENLSQTLQATWPRENEYAEAQKRLADLNAAMKKKDEAPPTEDDDAAADPAEEQATDRELYQTAYHGSPHTFDRFDDSQIGSGSGKQFFGHGFYLTDNKGIAETYRTPHGSEFTRSEGRLYHVDIPEDDELLALGKPINEQSPAITNAAQNLKKYGVTPADTGQQAYDTLTDTLGSQAAASKALAEAGIKGSFYEPRRSAFLDSKAGGKVYVMFDGNAAAIRTYEQAGYKGKIRLAPGKRPIITLMRDADASTFIHETGHQFLDELERDARHPMAPSTIRQDWKTTQDWLGVKEGQTVPTRAHEKFAKGFEQYLREGVAPSKELAGVFAKFKNWLMQIYRSVRGLGQPINEDIRGVFDRMLSTEPQRTVIAPERNMPLSLADIHEQDAAETDPAEAEPVMDRVIAETNNYITQQPPEVANARAAEPATSAIDEPPTGPADDAAGENSDGAGRTAEMGNSGSNPNAKPAVGGVRPQRQPVVQSGGQAGSKGASLSGSEQRPANQPNTGPLAPRPAERFPDAEPDLTDKAGNIRVENLTDQAEVAQAIHDSAERNADFSAVRGQMTKGQMMDLANSMGLDAAKLDEATLGRLLGGTADLGAKVLAARKLVVQSAAIVSAAMKKAAEGAPEDTIALAAAITRHDMIQSALAGVTAEWGRAGNAFHSLLGGWDKAQDINQFLRDNTGRDLFQLQRIAKLGAQLDDGGQVSKFVRDSTKRSFGLGILEYWINGLISGVQTHVTYTVGNGILWAERNLIETPLAAGIGAARSMAGRTGEVIPFGEAAARARGAVRAIPGATKSVVDAIRTGRTVRLPNEGETPDTPFSQENLARPGQYNPNATAAEAVGAVFGLVRGLRDGLVAGAALLKAGGVDGSPLLAWQQTDNGVIPDLALRGVNVLPVGTLARMPSRMVAAIHSFFRAINYSTEISGQAYRQAAAEGLAGLARDGRVADLRQNPTPDMMSAAIAGSNDLTLMGQGGKFTQKMASLTNMEFNVPLLGETQLLKFIDPFVRVSSNIIDQSLVQRTPLGIFSPEIRADLMGKNGNIAQDTASAKMLAGTALGVLFGTLASQGFASGSGPSDPKDAAMWRLAGNQAHSIRIGNIWYQINRLGPMGMLMSMAADMYDIGNQAEKGQYDLAGASLIHSITQNILDEGFMAGPSEWIEAIENSDTKGPSFVRNFLSSFLPYSVGMAQMSRAMDPYARQTRTILDAMKAKIPGLSESLLPRRDVWGEPIPNNTALGGRALTAIYEQQVGTDPVNQAMLNLGIALAQPERKIRNVTLSDQQYDDFTRIAGRMTKMRLDAIVRSPNFATWPPDVKHDVIMETVSQCREVARGVMMQKYPSIAVAATQARLLKSQGVPINGQ